LEIHFVKYDKSVKPFNERFFKRFENSINFFGFGRITEFYPQDLVLIMLIFEEEKFFVVLISLQLAISLQK